MHVASERFTGQWGHSGPKVCNCLALVHVYRVSPAAPSVDYKRSGSLTQYKQEIG